MTATTMTLNLPEPEMAAIDRLSKAKDLSKTAVVRQAIRLYELVDHRLAEGGRLMIRKPNGDVVEMTPIGPGLGVIE